MTRQELSALLEQGALCLAATERLRRSLVAEHAREQTALGRVRWTTPDVLTLGMWLERAAGSLALEENAGVAWWNRQQEAVLWRRIIEESPQGAEILNVPHAAEQAASAWRCVADWRLPMKDAVWETAGDTTAMREWARVFVRRCREARRHSLSGLAGAVIQALDAGRLAAPPLVVLAGMRAWTVLGRALVEALARAGARIEEYGGGRGACGRPEYRSFGGRTSEMRAAAEWALEHLRANPKLRLGIVVPDLRPVLDEWDAALGRVFPGGGDEPAPYHLSLGRPLASVGVVRAALLLARLASERVDAETAEAVLLTPYRGGEAEERIARAGQALEVRRRGGDVSTQELRVPGTARPPEKEMPSRWARILWTLLREMGWPGEGVSSEEHQAVEGLRGALRELASLDGVAGEMTALEAVQQWEATARSAVFRAENLGQPLQVMGADDAAGEQFDAVWLAGFDDRAWPPAARPEPLVPVALQRAAGLPEAVPAGWLKLYREATQELLACAEEVHVSYARADGEEPLSPSPLFAGPFVAAEDRVAEEGERARQERVEDVRAPSLAVKEAPGGASLLRDMAACPFRAFAVYRLEAEEFPQAELGLTARERGTILHVALSHCWDRLKTLAGLRAADEAELRKTIRESVRQAILACSQGVEEEFEAKVREVEQTRLERLLLAWMELEKQRGADFTVVGRETARVVDIGGLRLKTRFDRQDELADGRLVLIDYKSKAPSLSAWDGERPDEPQAPLYAVAAQEPLAALAFGQLRPGEFRFFGQAEEEGILPKVKTGGVPLAGRVEEWRRVLGGLAGQYKEGWAAVDPKRTKTCEHCHLPALCRVNEAGPSAEGDDDDAE
ncbi:MAG: PD-(D/E)XK nuclease family protein [Bryobacterales bacterium]|nr:PD-(D/E)XK nuclease family protein [Bryobacterales bacterium]